MSRVVIGITDPEAAVRDPNVDGRRKFAGRCRCPKTPQAKPVEFDGPGRTVIDGPFDETRKLVAGFWLWEVKDVDEAVAWIRRCPNPMPGPSEIETRPLYEMADLEEFLAPDVTNIHDRTCERLSAD